MWGIGIDPPMRVSCILLEASTLDPPRMLDLGGRESMITTVLALLHFADDAEQS